MRVTLFTLKASPESRGTTLPWRSRPVRVRRPFLDLLRSFNDVTLLGTLRVPGSNESSFPLWSTLQGFPCIGSECIIFVISLSQRDTETPLFGRWSGGTLSVYPWDVGVCIWGGRRLIELITKREVPSGSGEIRRWEDLFNRSMGVSSLPGTTTWLESDFDRWVRNWGGIWEGRVRGWGIVGEGVGGRQGTTHRSERRRST